MVFVEIFAKFTAGNFSLYSYQFNNMSSKYFYSLGLLLGSILFSNCTPGNKSASSPENLDSYLFVYFPSNENENLCYALSDDGYNFTPLNGGNIVMSSDTVTVKHGMRDPFILRGNDGRFFMVATDMKCAEGWDSNRGIVMLSSDDLVNWNHSTVHFPDRFPDWKNVIRVWAPEVIFDPEFENPDGSKGRNMVYFSLLTNDGKCEYDKIYYCYANDDFTDLVTEPVHLFDHGAATIDGDIIYDNKSGLYHLIYKNEVDSNLNQVTTCRLTACPGELPGSQWSKPSGTLQQTTVPVEGAGMYKLIDSDKWILMYDCYCDGYYQFCSTDDFETFTLEAQTETTGAFTPRHGTVIPITAQEKARLFKAFPMVDK
ncbi:MAG: glycoside hydrolase family 43 protein [Muribaculaceae bacterium]|nr:glycoside hydrolase family 43 protein [Muribaculaceae bacterium]